MVLFGFEWAERVENEKMDSDTITSMLDVFSVMKAQSSHIFLMTVLKHNLNVVRVQTMRQHDTLSVARGLCI